MFRHICTCALLLGASVLLSACGGGGGSDAPSTGDVSVVFTDGPTDQYDRILITMTGMTLIGPEGHVALYDGEPVTFDLLDMSDWGDLAFNTKVLAGDYSKIRLFISDIELIDSNAVDGVPVKISNLPANGKIDLNPRGPFEVSPDWTTVIKLDIDARRSFQVVATGNGKLQFRPIVFVDVFQGDIIVPNRLVRVFGSVEPGSIEGGDSAGDETDDSFRLCQLEFISQVSGPVLGDPDACVRVYADGGPSLFDDTGAEVGFSAVTDNAPLTAVGFLVDTDDAGAVLGLNSVIVALGDRRPDDVDGWGTVQGLVTSDPASSATCVAPDSCFDFDPDDADPVITRMQPGTRVFSADGPELAQTDVGAGDVVSIDALPVGGEEYAALIVLASDFGSVVVSGTLDNVGTAGSFVLLEVITDDIGGMAGVCVSPDTSVVQVLVDDDAVTLFDLLNPAVLEAGVLVEAYGDPVVEPAGCDIVADLVIVEPAAP
jgi:hypothetical protein